MKQHRTSSVTDAHREDATNAAYRQAGVDLRVCLHVDRTITVDDPESYREECDYCPAVLVVSRGWAPHRLATYTFRDPEDAV